MHTLLPGMNAATPMVFISLEELDKIIERRIKTTLAELESSKDREPEKAEVLLNEDEVRKKLNISHATLWKWNKDKYLCHVKIGRRVMWRESDINKLLEGGER